MTDPASIKGRLFAAVPTPLDESGSIHREGLGRLIDSLAATAIAGVSVGIQLDRGSQLEPDRTEQLLSAWRNGLRKSSLLIASAGASPATRRPTEVFEATLASAKQAVDLGVDVLLVQPPGAFRGSAERDRLVLEYHSVAAESGLPLLVSYRREASGGIAYGPEILAQLLARPEVLGVEIATIDGIVTFQQVEALVRDLAPGKLVVSGEERFLGYSLMCGADSAIVGLASAYPSELLDLIESHGTGDAARFLNLSKQVDSLARPIFNAPMDASVSRLLRTLVQLGVIPLDAAHDPRGPTGRPIGRA